MTTLSCWHNSLLSSIEGGFQFKNYSCLLQPNHWCLRFLKCGKLLCESTFNKKKVCLLLIEQIKTNQIVLYLPGGIWCAYKPPVMCHMSCVRRLMSPFNLFQIVRARDLQFSQTIHYNLCVQCHISGVTYKVSHIRCHMSCVMCHV